MEISWEVSLDPHGTISVRHLLPNPATKHEIGARAISGPWIHGLDSLKHFGTLFGSNSL